MACNYCNSTQEPDENGICPNCGRRSEKSESNNPSTDNTSSDAKTDDVKPTDATSADVKAADSMSTTMSEADELTRYPTDYWRCSWMYFFPHLLIALIIAGLFAGFIWGLHCYDKLDGIQNAYFNDWQKMIWIVCMAIPAIYAVGEFIFFLYKWYVKKYELHSREIHLVQGFFDIKTNITLLESLWGMELHQNLLEILFRIGKITLYSDDESAPVFRIKDIGNIRERFKKLISYQEHALNCSNVKVERHSVSDKSVQEWRCSWCDFIDETIWGIIITVISVLVLLNPWKFSPYIFLGLPVIYWCCGLFWTLCRGVFFTWFTTIFGVVMTAVYITLTFIPSDYSTLRFCLIMSVPIIYWCWLGWILVDRIFYTSYTLNNATLIKRHGIITNNIEVYVLYHIKDIDFSQNLWQRIVGDVGNIIFTVKWSNDEEGKEVAQVEGKEEGQEEDKEAKESKKEEKDNQKKGTKIVLHGLKNHKELYKTFRDRRLDERHRRQA